MVIRLHLHWKTICVKMIQIASVYFTSVSHYIKFYTDEARLANGQLPNPNVAQPEYYGTLSLKPRFTFMWPPYSVPTLAKKFRLQVCFHALKNSILRWEDKKIINTYIFYVIIFMLSHITFLNALLYISHNQFSIYLCNISILSILGIISNPQLNIFTSHDLS